MRKMVIIFISFCVFLGVGNIANAGSKNICLHNKGGYIAKLQVYNGTRSSYTHIYETGNITEGFTKCLQIPDSLPTIEIIAYEVSGGPICDGAYYLNTMKSFPDTVTITTKGTIFGASCEGLP